MNDASVPERQDSANNTFHAVQWLYPYQSPSRIQKHNDLPLFLSRIRMQNTTFPFIPVGYSRAQLHLSIPIYKQLKSRPIWRYPFCNLINVLSSPCPPVKPGIKYLLIVDTPRQRQSSRPPASEVLRPFTVLLYISPAGIIISTNF